MPPSEKDATRYLVRNALRVVNFFGAERMVRINQGEAGLKDLEFVIPHNVHLVLIPKVESGDQVAAVDEKITDICRDCGRKEPVFLMPIIESGRGILKALEIVEASPATVALTIGLEDYTADIGAERTREGRESFYARSVIVNAARRALTRGANARVTMADFGEALRQERENRWGTGASGRLGFSAR